MSYSKRPAPGQALMAASEPVVIASDQSAIPVSSTQLPSSLGAKTAANSFPVTLSTDGAFATNFGAKDDSAATTDTGTFSLIALTKRLLSSVTGLTAVGHTTTVTITRPSDTTAYAVGDAIGDTGGSAILTFTNMGKASGNIIITGCHLQFDVSAIPSGMSTFTLELYNAAPDAIADNVAWDLSSAGDRGKYLGSLTLTTPTDKGSTLFSQNDSLNHQVLLASTSLYAVLRTDSAFTPTSAAVKHITLNTVEV